MDKSTELYKSRENYLLKRIAVLEEIAGVIKTQIGQCSICENIQGVRFVASQNSWPDQFKCTACGHNNKFQEAGK